jgi:tetratricopeptide (TPR) repeat protein
VRGLATLRAASANPATVVGSLAFVVFLIFAANEGGYPATVWYPAALFLLALLVVTLVVLRPLELRVAAAVATAFLGGFAVWSFASIAWSGVTADAWDGANRTLFYLVVYALFVVLPWSSAAAAFLLGAYAIAVVAIGGATFLAAARVSDPGEYFIAGRFTEPMGYQNANAALFLLVFWPLLFLSTRRPVPAELRGLALAGGGVALELALLAQSRGSLVAAPAVVLVYLALVPGRRRALLAFALLAVAVGAAAPTLLDVYPAVRAGDAEGELDAALAALLVSAAGLFAVGTAWALVDRRVELPDRLLVGLRRATATAASVVLVAAMALALSADPIGSVRDAWDDFKVDERANTSSSFARGLSTNRYDIWRVAWKEFRDSPVEGIGADNFGAEYLLHRRGIEETLYPHSLELRTLTQLGLVGAVLLGGFFLFALFAALRPRVDDSLGAGVAATGVVVVGYWLVHGSVDWFWEVPGLTCPALACLALAGRIRHSPRPHPRRRLPGWAIASIGAALVLGSALSLALPWLAEKETQRALGTWRSDPAQAFSRLERARRLNPLSDKPDMLAGAIASRLEDTTRMQRAFQGALVRNPYNWYAQFELGILAASQGDRREALRRLAAVRSLNPREPALALALEQVRRGRRVSLAEYDRLFFARAEAVED